MKRFEDGDFSGRPLVVLVVDDEHEVRLSAVMALEELGFETIEAANSAAALAVLEARHDIDLLFTDVRMPGDMDGVDLAFTVRGRWPAVAIIIVSGFFDLKGAHLPNGAAFLAKPYRVQDLKPLIDKQFASRPKRA